MTTKTMVQRLCEQCSQSHTCQEVYEKLGNSTGPSVASKVIVAFLLPIVVFVASLAALEHLLAVAIGTKQLRTAISCLLALSVTVGLIMLVRAAIRQFHKTA